MIVETIKRTYKKTRFVGTKLPHGIVLHEESLLTQVEKTPELDLWGQNSPHDIVLHDENLLTQVKKTPEPRPIRAQRHRGSCDIEPTLDTLDRENPRTPSHLYTVHRGSCNIGPTLDTLDLCFKIEQK